jgi:dihydrofolate reductase
MGKIIMFNFVSLDGFFAGKNGAIDWHQMDEEFQEFVIIQLRKVGGLIFGRKTYDLMFAYWPLPGVIESDPHVAEKMNGLPKTVFSKTMQHAEWNNTVVANQIESRMNELRQSDNDHLVLGSGDLCESLINAGLIDEFRMIVNPLILGDGIPMFKANSQRVNLNLSEAKTFRSGKVMLSYERRP